MTGVLAEVYPLVRALHIIAIIAWMAGMLYLPRLTSTTRTPSRARSNPRPSR